MRWRSRISTRKSGRSSRPRRGSTGDCCSACRILSSDTGSFDVWSSEVPASLAGDAAFAAGARRRPQAFGQYFSEDGGSCALGAAYEGAYVLPRDQNPSIRPRLDRLFDCLENVRRRCPEGCNKRLPLNAIILHLNDDHHWTREKIVEWLKKD